MANSSRALGRFLGMEPMPLEECNLTDFLPGLDIAPIRLPVTVGKYEIVTEAYGGYQDASGGECVTTGEVEAQLDLTAGTPANIPAGKCLAGLTFYRAQVTATGATTTEVHDEETGTTYTVELEIERGAWVVDSDSVLNRLWECYGINLGSLTAIKSVASVSYGRPQQWVQLRKSLYTRAFGDTAYLYGRISNVMLEGVDTRQYLELTDVVPLIAFLELIQSGDLKIPLPSADCAIRLEAAGSDKAEVIYFDHWHTEGYRPMPFQDAPKKIADKVLKLFRLRENMLTTERDYYEEVFKQSRMIKAAQDFAINKEHADKQIFRDFETIGRQVRAKQTEVISLYVELTEWAAKYKEQALDKLRRFNKAEREVITHREGLADRREVFVQLPNNMEGLPAHFAAIPNGLENGLVEAKDETGRAILLVRRAGIELGSLTKKDHNPITFQLHLLEKQEQDALIAYATTLLGANGPRWLIPQGLVAISKLYRDKGGYGSNDSVKIYLNEWVATMRPAQIERFKQKGYGDAFRGFKSKELFLALIGVLERLTYSNTGRAKSYGNLYGFYTKQSDGQDDNGAYWVRLRLNSDLQKFIVGEDGFPFMVTNTKAMFNHSPQSLDHAPAAQWSLEQLARTNLYRRADSSVIQTPKGDGTTRLALAQRFGLLQGPNDSPAKVLRKLGTILDNLQEVGVIANIYRDGAEKTGASAFEVPLHIEMHEDYAKAYRHARKENDLIRAEKETQRPFSAPKATKAPSLLGDSSAPPKRRGRPPKAK